MAHRHIRNRTRMSLKERGRRGLSLFLAMLMTLSLVQIGAFAGTGPRSSTEQIVEYGSTTYWNADGAQVTEDDSSWITSVAKNIEGTETENKFKITLEVETTFEKDQVQVASDTDVVLVMDTSNSMGYCSECGKPNATHDHHQYQYSPWYGSCWCGYDHEAHQNVCDSFDGSRLEAAQEAAIAFIQQYAAGAAGTTAQRNLAIVAFDSDAKTLMGWTNVANGTGTAETIIKNLYCGCASQDPNSNSAGGTNTHAGLLLARNLLKGRTNSTYVVLLTDGAPTFAMNNSSFTSTNEIYREGRNRPNYMGDGTYTTDAMRNNAASVATEIKQKDTTLYTICYDHKTDGENARWLRQSVATSSAHALTPQNAGELETVFGDIAQDIQIWTEAYVVTDPMGPQIAKAELDPDYDGRASISGPTLTWNVKDSPRSGSRVENGKTYYSYILEYYVWLDNTSATNDASNVFDTNGNTTMTYVQVVDGKPAGDIQTATFTVPQVKSLFASLSFEKAAFEDSSKHISATFTLTHDTETCTCEATDSPRTLNSTYDSQTGMITFLNIPSGHTYILEETGTENGYVTSKTPYTVDVSWENATIDTSAGSDFEDNVFLNKLDPQNTSLTITKTWLPAGSNAPVNSLSLTVEGWIESSDEAVESRSATVSAPGWTTTVRDLPTIDVNTGEAITYTVTEPESDLYDAVTSRTVNCKQDSDSETYVAELINQITDQYELTITKDWGGLSDDYKTPVQVQLIGQAGTSAPFTVGTYTLNSSSWTKTVKVDRYSGNDEIVYSVKELDKDGTAVSTGTVTLGNSKTYNVEIQRDENSFTVTNTLPQAYTVRLDGVKQWVDGNDEQGKRPTSVQVDLLADGVVVDTVNVTADGGWDYSWTGLPKFAVKDTLSNNAVQQILNANTGDRFTLDGHEITYTVKEHSVPTGYTSEVDGSNIINTLEDIGDNTEIPVTKTWKDDSDAAGTRPADVTLSLYAEGSDTAANSHTFYRSDFYSFDKVIDTDVETLSVPKYNADGSLIQYNVKEEEETGMRMNGLDGVKYSVTYDQAKHEVLNALGPDSDTVTLTVTKIWQDGGNRDARPASIDVTVTSSLGSTTVTLDGRADSEDELADGTGEIAGWKAQFTLSRFDNDGKEIKYTVSSITESADNDGLAAYQDGRVTVIPANGVDYAFQLTNTLKPAPFSLKVHKNWVDNTNIPASWVEKGFAATTSYPESVTVTLTGTDGTNKTLTLNAANNWDAVANNLNRYDSQGNKISYTVSEATVTGYGSEVGNFIPDSDGSGNYTVTLTNTFTQPSTKVEGTKTWMDGNSTDNRPASITVGLFANGFLVDQQPVDASDGWSYSFLNLPTYSGWTAAGSTAIQYTVAEMDGTTPVADKGSITYGDYSYTVTYNGQDITNTRTSDGGSSTLQFSVSKVWVGPASTSVSFGLFQNDTQIATIYGTDMLALLTNQNVWTGAFAPQPKYDDNGDAYIYEVKELGDNGSAVSADGNEHAIVIGGTNYTAKGTKTGTGYVFTNTVEQEYITVSGQKLWENADGKIPASIDVAVYADGVKVDRVDNPVAVAPDANGLWSYTFENLPKYALDNNGDGHELTYTVKEVGVVDATSTVKYGDHYFTVTGGTADDSYNITNTYKDSDVYQYYVVVNYVTHYSDGSPDKVEGEFTYQDLTSISGGSTASITPPASLQHGGVSFSFDTDHTGNVLSQIMTTPGTYKLVMWYERTENVAVPKFTVTVNYYDENGNKIAPSHSETIESGKAYDVTAYDAIAIAGYTYNRTEGDPLKGTMNSDKVIDVYYTTNGGSTPGGGGGDDGPTIIPGEDPEDPPEEIPEENVPTTDLPEIDPPTTDLPEENVPTTDLPEEEVPMAEAPATGDSLSAWILAAAVSGAGLVWLTLTGKKRKEDDIL